MYKNDTPQIQKRKKKILSFLREHYNKTGRDFYFKSKHVDLPLNNSVIGRILNILYDEGKVLIWNDSKRSHDLTYRTNFSKKPIGE